MKPLLLLLTIFVLVITGCGLGVSDYDDAVLDGVSNLNTDKHEEALQDFTRAIEIDPTRADGWAGRGNVLQAMGQYEASLQDIKPLRLIPGWPMPMSIADLFTAIWENTKRPLPIMKRDCNWILKSTIHQASSNAFSAMSPIPTRVFASTSSI